MNRDIPETTGDWEINGINDPNSIFPYCPPINYYYVQAQVVGDPNNTIYHSADEVKCYLDQVVHFVVNRCNPYGNGMYCKNDENTLKCLNYRVRFCCGESNRT